MMVVMAAPPKDSEFSDEMARRLLGLIAGTREIPYVRVKHEGEGHYGIVDKPDAAPKPGGKS